MGSEIAKVYVAKVTLVGWNQIKHGLHYQFDGVKCSENLLGITRKDCNEKEVNIYVTIKMYFFV